MNRLEKQIRFHHARSLEKRQLRFKRRKKALRRMESVRANLLKSEQTRSELLGSQDRFKDYRKHRAPEDFSIIGNHEKVIDFCNAIYNDLLRKRKVFVNLSGVKHITNESLGLLVSNMIMFRQRRIDFNGNFPLDENSKKVVVESGFLETLYPGSKQTSVNNVNNAIYTHFDNKSNSDIVEAIIDSSSKFLWGTPCNCSGVYNAMIELMLNTYEHADQIEGNKKWWMTVTKDEVEQKVTYSFFDYGRGIISTLRNTHDPRHRSVVQKILHRLHNSDDADAVLLREVLEGALVISEKKESQYGHGLHSIYEDFEDNYISNLIIISNGVYADFKHHIYQRMHSHFRGSFISWEIDKSTPHEIKCSN